MKLWAALSLDQRDRTYQCRAAATRLPQKQPSHDGWLVASKLNIFEWKVSVMSASVHNISSYVGSLKMAHAVPVRYDSVHGANQPIIELESPFGDP